MYGVHIYICVSISYLSPLREPISNDIPGTSTLSAQIWVSKCHPPLKQTRFLRRKITDSREITDSRVEAACSQIVQKRLIIINMHKHICRASRQGDGTNVVKCWQLWNLDEEDKELLGKSEIISKKATQRQLSNLKD